MREVRLRGEGGVGGDGLRGGGLVVAVEGKAMAVRLAAALTS